MRACARGVGAVAACVPRVRCARGLYYEVPCFSPTSVSLSILILIAMASEERVIIDNRNRHPRWAIGAGVARVGVHLSSRRPATLRRVSACRVTGHGQAEARGHAAPTTASVMPHAARGTHARTRDQSIRQHSRDAPRVSHTHTCTRTRPLVHITALAQDAHTEHDQHDAARLRSRMPAWVKPMNRTPASTTSASSSRAQGEALPRV